MLKARSITADLVKATIADCLTIHVGPGRRWSDAEAARMADTSESSVKNWRGGMSSPEPHNLLKLYTIPELGPDLADRCLGLVGMSTHPVDHDAVCHFRLSSVIAQAGATLTRALEDQIIDHQEKPKIEAAVRAVKTMCEQYLNQKKGN